MSCHFRAFTVTSDPEHPGAKRLRESALYWGWDLRVHVLKEGWDRTTYRAEQLGQLDFFRQQEPDYALYLDAWDTMFSGPPQELMPRLRGGQLWFCGDTVLTGWKDKPWGAHLVEEAFPTCPTWGHPFVNAGVIWGDTRVWRELAADYLQNYRATLINQDYFNMRYLMEKSLGRERLLVDYTSQVAFNIMNVEARHTGRMPSNRITYTPFRATPLVVHSPGQGQAQPMALMPHWMEETFKHE